MVSLRERGRLCLVTLSTEADRERGERIQESRRMSRLLDRIGLRYNEKAIVAGAQTERRGEAGPVRVLLRGWDAPAALHPLAHVSTNPVRGNRRQRVVVFDGIEREQLIVVGLARCV